MLNEFRPGELPGGDVKGASVDITSYKRIEEAAKLTIESCMMKRYLYGWMQIGMTCSRAFFTSWSSLPNSTAVEFPHLISLLLSIEGRRKTLKLMLTDNVRLWEQHWRVYMGHWVHGRLAFQRHLSGSIKYLSNGIQRFWYCRMITNVFNIAIISGFYATTWFHHARDRPISI